VSKEFFMQGDESIAGLQQALILIREYAIKRDVPAGFMLGKGNEAILYTTDTYLASLIAGVVSTYLTSVKPTATPPINVNDIEARQEVNKMLETIIGVEQLPEN